MTRTPVALALSLLLAAGPMSAFATDGQMSQSPAASTKVESHAHDAQMKSSKSSSAIAAEQNELSLNHGETGRGQGSGVEMPNRGEMAADSMDAQRASKPVQMEPIGETARGQGSGVEMSNRGETAAESMEAQRAARPVQMEPLGETGRGQGSGLTMADGPEMAADQRVDRKSGSASSQGSMSK